MTDAARISELTALLKLDYEDRKLRAGTADWEAYENASEHSYPKHTPAGLAPMFPVNLFFPYKNSILPQVAIRNPNVMVNGMGGPGSENKAAVLQALLQQMIQALKLKKELRLAAGDAFHCGTGFIAVGYDSEFGWLSGAANEFGSFATSAKGQLLEYATNVIPGMPWALRAHPRDILLSAGARTSRDIRRYTLHSRRLLSDVKADERYAKSARNKVTATRPMELTSDNADVALLDQAPGGEPKEPMVDLFEVHDLHTNELYVLAAGLDMFLLKDDDFIANLLGRPPIVPMVWNLSSRSVWGVSDARLLDDFQKQLNNVNTLYMHDLRSNITKFLYDKNVLDEAAFAGLVSEVPGIGIGVDDISSEVLREILPRDLGHYYTEMENIKSNARETLGITRGQLGGISAPSKRATGYEIRSADMGATMRGADRKEALEDVITEVAGAWVQIITSVWEMPRIANVKNLLPPYDWIIFRGIDLAGRYDYGITSSDEPPTDKQSMQQEAMQLGPTLLQLGQSVQGADARAVLEMVLRNYPNADVNKILGPSQARQPGMVGMLLSNGQIMAVPGQQSEQSGQSGQGQPEPEPEPEPEQAPPSREGDPFASA